MIHKQVPDAASAVADVPDGATILVGGFGGSGLPAALIDALADRPVRELVLVSNNVGAAGRGVAVLIQQRQVRKVICSFPQRRHAEHFLSLYRQGEIELELVPQGTLSERMRAAGAGLGGFFTPAGADSPLAHGKEVRVIDGRKHVFEKPLPADVALIKADRADRWGNLVYRTAARNFGPTMATAAALTVVQVRQFVELGELDPEAVVTPGIFVDRVVEEGT